MNKLLSEVKRREVIRPLIAYIGASWVLLQVIDVMSNMLSLPPLFATGVLLVLICGLPIMAYLSWHFDISFSGFKRIPSLGSAEATTGEPFGWLNWSGLAVIALLSAVGGVQLFESIRDEQMAEQEGLSTVKKADAIAVLPFVDQSPDQDQSYLAVGVAEEITNQLGRINSFRVMASRSSQVLSEAGLGPIDIGRRLQVDAILTGSIRMSGSRLRIRVELLDTEDNRTLWSESFLREIKDVFEIESEISRAVVNLLQDEYLQSGAFASIATTKSSDAYVMYLRGREAYRKQTTESMREARTLFEQTLALDPEYAQAYVALADTLAALSEGGEGFGVLKPEIAATLAEKNLNKAISRQPDIADIYAVMGVVNLLRNNFDDALQSFDKAIALNPSQALAYMWKSLALNELQRYEEAIEALEKSRQLDPLFITSTWNYGTLLAWRGRTEEAEAIFRGMQEDFPDSPFSHTGLADIYFGRGDYLGALLETKKALALSPDNDELLRQMIEPMLQLGLTDIVKRRASDPTWSDTIEPYTDNMLFLEGKHRELFERMDFAVAANPDDYWIAFEAGWYHAMLGNEENAAELLLGDDDTLSDADRFEMPYCTPAMEIAWAHRQSGDEERYREFLTRCKKLLKEQEDSSIAYFELDYLSARIHALEGNKDQALNSLDKAIDKGWREWWTESDPLLNGLHDEAAYQASIERIREDLARQREGARLLFADD